MTNVYIVKVNPVFRILCGAACLLAALIAARSYPLGTFVLVLMGIWCFVTGARAAYRVLEIKLWP